MVGDSNPAVLAVTPLGKIGMFLPHLRGTGDRLEESLELGRKKKKLDM